MSSSNETRFCTTCGVQAPISEFKALRGSRLVRNCLACRSSTRSRVNNCRKRTADAVASPPRHTRTRPILPHLASQNTTPLSPTLPALIRPPAQPRFPASNHPQESVIPRATEADWRLRGVHSSDDPSRADARRVRVSIQREHRLQRRRNEEPSPTPSLSQLIRTHKSLESLHSSSPTQYSQLQSFSNENLPLQLAIPDSPLAQALDIQSELRGNQTPSTLRSLAPSPVPSETHPTGLSPIETPNRDDFIAPLPLQTLPPFRDLTQPALSENEWALLQEFHQKIREPRLETCETCRERWFGLQLNNDGVCSRCVRVDRGHVVPLFGAENKMQPDPIPAHLPELTQVEQILISRTHVFLEVRLVRGQQYRYRGHIVHFLRDIGRVYDQLPLLPTDLDILILRPSNTDQVPGLSRQFRRDMRVRRSAIVAWLDFLRHNHPGYRDVEISMAAIERLPEDDSVDHLLPSQVIDAEPTDDSVPQDIEDDPVGIFNIDPDEPECAAVPDLLATEDEVTAIRNMVNPTTVSPPNAQPYIVQPSFRPTPISEFNNTIQLLSLAFPTLFPRGSAEFVLPRERKVEYSEYIKHLIKHESGRFGRHPRFRYIAFNTIMRRQASNSAGFFVRQRNGQENPTAEDLREAFSSNDPESESLLRSISAIGSSIRGTRSYWGGRRQDLQNHIQELGAAHFFLTLSAADLHWEDLMRYLPLYDQWRTGNSSQRNRIARDNIRDNPHIVAYWFQFRFQVFKEVVLDRKFKICDFWFRYEWQGRGSTHVHGVYWVKFAPDSENLESVELRDAFTRFWGIHILAINPEPSRQPPSHSERPIM